MTTITLVYDFEVSQEDFDSIMEIAGYTDCLGQFIDEWEWVGIETNSPVDREYCKEVKIKFIEDDKQYSVTAYDIERAVKRIIETRDDVGLHGSNRRLVQEFVSTNDWGLCDGDMARWIIEVACFGECIYG